MITILRLLKRVLAFSITIKPQIHNMEIFLFSVVILGPAVWSIALTSHRITRTIRCNHSLVFIHSSSICLLMNCQVARIPQVENMVSGASWNLGVLYCVAMPYNEVTTLPGQFYEWRSFRGKQRNRPNYLLEGSSRCNEATTASRSYGAVYGAIVYGQ